MNPLILKEKARELMDAHGLEDWEFIITQQKTFMGYCWYRRKRIGFSIYFLHCSEAEILDTILHEIAHALAPAGAGHGPEWKRVAVSVGCRPRSCGDGRTSAQPNYVMHCPECGREWRRFRMKRRNYGSLCPECNVPVLIYRVRRSDNAQG